MNYTQEVIAKSIIDFCLKRYKFIYISGNGGSGKTTFSKTLVNELNSMSIRVNCIDMDEFVLDTKMRKSAKKHWTDISGKERVSEYTTSFKESYYLAAPEVIIHSIKNNLNCFYKPKKQDHFLEIKAEYPLTIIEGVGSAFLEKNEQAVSLFMMCEESVEINRRIERSRDGEDLLKYEDVKRKAIERNEHFQVNILPNLTKYDIELQSLEDYSLLIKRDDLKIFGS